MTYNCMQPIDPACPSPSAEPTYPQALHYLLPNTLSQLGVVYKLTEGALNPLIIITDKDIEQNCPQYWPWGTLLVTNYQPDLTPFIILVSQSLTNKDGG